MPRYIVEVDGKRYTLEGDHPPSEDEARGAIGTSPDVSAEPPAARAPRIASSRTGPLTGQAANDNPNLAPDFGAAAAGFAQNFNPLALYESAKHILTTDPRTTIPELAKAPFKMAGDILSGGSGDNSNASRAMGSLLGAPAPGALMSGVGRLMKYTAPKAMELGLDRTKAMRKEFPGSAQRLVAEGITPDSPKLDAAMKTTESKVQSEMAAHDAQRFGGGGNEPWLRRNFLLPETKVPIQLGEPPTPQGGQLATTQAAVTQLREQNQVRRLQGLQPHNPRDPIFGATSGGQNLATGHVIDVPSAVADTVTGPGAVMQPAPPSPYRGGAPPTMADPYALSDEAYKYAYDKLKLGGLGNVPGPEVEALQAARAQYLKQNTVPLTGVGVVDAKRSYGGRAAWDKKRNAPIRSNESTTYDEGLTVANKNAAIRMNPAIEADLAKEQDLLGALVARDNRDTGPGGLITMSPTHTLYHAITRSPTVNGSVALGLNATGNALQRASPMAIRVALAQLMASHDQQ